MNEMRNRRGNVKWKPIEYQCLMPNELITSDGNSGNRNFQHHFHYYLSLN